MLHDHLRRGRAGTLPLSRPIRRSQERVRFESEVRRILETDDILTVLRPCQLLAALLHYRKEALVGVCFHIELLWGDLQLNGAVDGQTLQPLCSFFTLA